MRVGLLYRAAAPAGDLSPEERLDRMVAQARAADALGYDSLWVEEGPGGTGDCPALPVLLATLAGATRSLRLGGLAVFPLVHPASLAESFAMVDIFSGGRLDLGLCTGKCQDAYRVYSVPWEERFGRLAEGVDFLRRAWTTDDFAYRGRYYRFPANAPESAAPFERRPDDGTITPQWERGGESPPHLAVTPKPIQEPHPPLFLSAADGPEAIDLAARAGLSCIVEEADTEAAGRYRRALAAAGRCEAEVELVVVADMFPSTPGAPAPSGLPASAPGELVARLRRIQAQTGASHLLWRLPFPPATHEAVLGALRLFAREIHPLLQA